MSKEAVYNNLQVNISYRQILTIALPISLAILVPQLNYITNNIFLGQLSEQSLAAAAITGVYYLIFAAIGVPLVAVYTGFVYKTFRGKVKLDEMSY